MLLTEFLVTLDHGLLLHLLCNMNGNSTICSYTLICGWLWYRTSDSSKYDCRSSRSSVLSSSQFALLRSLKVRPLMISVFRTSTYCPTFGRLFEPLCSQGGSWLRSRSQDSWNLPFFNILHTCWTAQMLMSHPLCDGGGLVKVRLASFRKSQLLIHIPISAQEPIWGLSQLGGSSSFFPGKACFTLLKLSVDTPPPQAHLLQHSQRQSSIVIVIYFAFHIHLCRHGISQSIWVNIV